jgi:hypothetical protein
MVHLFHSALIIASRTNLVLLGTFITLLQAVSFTSQDRDALKKLWERLKWQLRVSSRGNELFEGALRRLDDKRTWVENILEKGFTPVRPLRKVHEGGTANSVTYMAARAASVGGFPDFAAQSMEDLLNAEGLMAHNVNNTQGFSDGFVGFEEFSGWDGFDINNL